MKNVLIVAYHFPPGGGPGVQRVLKHVTYLRQFGWNPIVLTVLNGDFPARDESLLKKIPSDVVVIRTKIIEPYSLYRKFIGGKGASIDVNVNKTADQRTGFKEKFAEWIRATFFIPDARIGWLPTAKKSALKAITDYKISAVYSSSPPYTCALIARSIKRKTGLPWVAGFRDPWTNFLTTPERWFVPAMIDKKLERTVFEEADAVESAWQGITEDALQKYPHLNREKFHHVPNGYDSSDFPVVQYQRTDKFTITYTGSLYGHRNPASFLAALELLNKSGVLDVNKVSLRFVGRFGAEVDAMLQSTLFAPAVDRIQYVPHEKSIEYALTSDALLIIVDDTKESAEIVPGKVYEYLGAGRPIIGIAPKGSAIERLVHGVNAGRCTNQDDVSGLAEIISNLYKHWKNNTNAFERNETEIEKFERKQSAEQLARILDKVTQL
ncbi:MAG: hypothetical protein HQ472_09580 [Ignavibacteria bacterium]|nr:hypothetical protein [Ignavibacteria bacterium]